MAANILGVRISKSQQLSNWEAEQLSSAQQMYAATDAWVCREMYLKLLQSEKHPLTPEELNPPQPQPAQQPKVEAAPAEEGEKAKARKRRRRHRSKSKKSAEAQQQDNG